MTNDTLEKAKIEQANDLLAQIAKAIADPENTPDQLEELRDQAFQLTDQSEPFSKR